MRGLLLGLAAVLLLQESPAALAAEDVFNPYRHKILATSQRLADGEKILLDKLGGQTHSLQKEVAFRPDWKSEVYPVVFGNKEAPDEILVLLDYAVPESQSVWQEVLTASRSLDPGRVKIVVMGKSREKYAVELMGGAVWLARQRPDLAREYLRLTLERWNRTKQAQRQREGKARPFQYEYDAVASPTEYPILYSVLKQLLPDSSEKTQFEVWKGAYNAGNVNCYQAVDAAYYYHVNVPAVIVNGKPLSRPVAAAIIGALR